MSFFQIRKEKRLSKQAVLTLVNHTIFQFGNSLSLIFINLYLWRLTESLMVNGLFNVTAIMAQAVTTLLIGRLAKRKGHLVMYRYGIFLTAAFYLCVIATRESMVEYFVWFALIRGMAQSTYWLSYFTLAHEVSNNENRHRYLGWNQALMGVANLIGPAVAGYVISFQDGLLGYTIVFTFAFVMFILATIGSFQLNKEESHHTQYYMKLLPLILKREKRFGYALVGWFLLGFPQGIMMYVPPILLFVIFPNESFIGTTNALFLSLSILASYVIARFGRLDQTRTYLFVSAAGMLLSASFLFWEISIWTVLLFMSIYSLFRPLQANTYGVYYFTWLDRIPLKTHFRVETVVLREAIINGGRGLGVVIFMLFASEINPTTVPLVLSFVLVLQLGVPYLIKK
ncbi:MFS transporter [Halalkalibacter sp. APA_J-10(15)]|uniref:MFS transporter n=1 Tax=Halalkalibacter sp. APA_J-10(15) TaxID=2933805 RepID=UPI001FF2404B|nr:MFS transporter [Halalkalibacter sp. APA_J-10(15)]MCK0471582.1 MFS transporter [Halalkalibacter sp. APA_J-10(15)]